MLKAIGFVAATAIVAVGTVATAQFISRQSILVDDELKEASKAFEKNAKSYALAVAKDVEKEVLSSPHISDAARKNVLDNVHDILTAENIVQVVEAVDRLRLQADDLKLATFVKICDLHEDLKLGLSVARISKEAVALG